MPRSLAFSPPSKTAHPHSARASVTGGNGAPVPETDAERIAHLEALMERMQQTLDVQFRRMAEMQMQLDFMKPPPSVP